MNNSLHHGRASLALLSLLLLAACDADEAPVADPVRPVRVAAVERRDAGETLTLPGQIQAQDEVSLSFRVDGRMVERLVNVGDTVQAGQVVARLDPEPTRNALRAARANLTAAMGQQTLARNDYERQETLLRQGWTTRARYDAAAQALKAAQAQVDAAQAQFDTAQDRLGYTELVADGPGTVTARGAEPGEVVAAGRMIVHLARQGGRDAVFDVPASAIRDAPANPVVTVSLVSDPTVRAIGRVREVAPQADPVTRTFKVRVGLQDPPEALRLGSTVNGSMQVGGVGGIEIPATALTQANQQPAVWIVDRATNTVALRNIDLDRYDLARVMVARGLEADEIVVTAGVQALRPGQKVRILGEGS
ncbi:efflux RND transporter periplasmic adaptor subunit [Azospirillum rugosum]|uniref:RND family efflux transporter MFP subunit n=1 Tax=Azospirillum rugosum TaxID=416170 RepID=A0ABS4SKF0_9PROT|nr:efflux RND transporter periplasmic adaptor subunit [Azospirillum rugosum]MBP2292568.1 RND family efflux transporter MFP subunit [Azospirillum rugosum]MDQ0526408.1 RND family efflux transporter MFP subunit [Azospirillum rugosum]